MNGEYQDRWRERRSEGWQSADIRGPAVSSHHSALMENQFSAPGTMVSTAGSSEKAWFHPLASELARRSPSGPGSSSLTMSLHYQFFIFCPYKSSESFVSRLWQKQSRGRRPLLGLEHFQRPTAALPLTFLATMFFFFRQCIFKMCRCFHWSMYSEEFCLLHHLEK